MKRIMNSIISVKFIIQTIINNEYFFVIMHDIRLFANMDLRQRETLFRLAQDVCTDNEYQYICSINEDALLSINYLISISDYSKIITDDKILKLNDYAPESKLLGIQADIDLEDNSKSVGNLG